MTENKCPDCGGGFDRIELHLAKSHCNYPEYTSEQKEILTGLLMGDANIDYHSANNPRWRVSMINKEFLEFLTQKFEEHIAPSGVSLSMTAEENVKKNIESGFSDVACVSDYSDIYVIRSFTNPELQEFAEWYSTGNKIFPESIELTPTVLKYWYVSDGSLKVKNEKPYITFAASNELDRKDNLLSLFKNIGFDNMNCFINERKCGSENFIIAVRGYEDSIRMLKYMGKPLPGFEYKWEYEQG